MATKVVEAETVSAPRMLKGRRALAAPVDASEQDLPGSEAATPEMRALAHDYRRHNAEANKATREAKAAATKLEAAMGLSNCRAFTIRDGNKVVDVTLGPGEREYVDPRTIYDAVGLDRFLALVKIAKGDVEDLVGAVVLARSLRTKATPDALKVRERGRKR